MGFDELAVGPFRRRYFHGVESRLTRLGARVYSFPVHPLASVAARAESLKKALDAIDAPRVNIVAHSMGGLDARYLASRLGAAGRVASIVTVGTPHRGTPLADLGAGLWLVAPMLRMASSRLGVDAEGLFDLTSARMQHFNEVVPDVPGVFYGAWLAKATRARDLTPLLLPTWTLLGRKAGDNDGLVPVSSQRWGESCGTVEADHWAQIGWAGDFDAPAFYEGVVRDLVGRGL
jgi:triacylglycerol lipase